MNPDRAGAQRAFALAALRLPALFVVVFYGADALAALHSRPWRLHADWELSIPYWPAAYPLYLSVLVVPFAPLFLLHDAGRVRAWERAMAASVLASGAVFVALPATLGYAPADAGRWQLLADFTRLISGRHNLLPSLHVALSLVTLLAMLPAIEPRWRALPCAWFALLVGSVLVTHQHHVADVVAGALVGGVAGRRLRFPR